MTDSILVTRSSMPSLEEYIEEIAPLWESHWLTNMGVKHKQFEALLKDRLAVENVALYTNGHNALEGVFEAMRLGADGRKKVVTTPFTFASTTHALVRKGLSPVFADIRSDNFTLDPKSIEAVMDEEVCAIVPVHVYGNPCDIEAIQRIADNWGVKVIYDAAHAFGVWKGGQSVASFGDASMFSFHATKVFNTIEGGAVCFKDSSLGTVLNQWKNFGITGPESVEYIGGNAKMNEFCAAMGICNLRHLDEEIAKRRVVSQRYWDQLAGVSGVYACQPSVDVQYNYAYLPVVFGEDFGATRDDVYAALAQENIFARKYFYPLVSNYECYAGMADSSDTPVAKDVAQRVLTLPLYADLALEDVNRICSIVKSCKR